MKGLVSTIDIRPHRMIDLYRPEIVVASVHHVRNEPFDVSGDSYQKAIEACGSLETLFCVYYDQQYELIKSLAKYTSRFPVVLGHMDLIKIFQAQSDPDFLSTAKIWERIIRNIRLATDSGLVFEVNSRGFKKGVGQYPDACILGTIAAIGGQITFGEDSHSKADVGMHFAEAKRIVSQFFSKAVVFKSNQNGGYVKLEESLS